VISIEARSHENSPPAVITKYMLDYLLVAVLVITFLSFQRGIPESRLCENVSEP